MKIDTVALPPGSPSAEALNAAVRIWRQFGPHVVDSAKCEQMARVIDSEFSMHMPVDSHVEVKDCHGLDTPSQVFFYEQDFYVLSNFSAFKLWWRELHFDTSEQAYHWEKFPDAPQVQWEIAQSVSAHEAFKIAEQNKSRRRPDWDAIKVDTMLAILRAKAEQHEYVRRKLLATGERELVENSWRDGFWGWGPDRNGQNHLGRLWMKVRAELRAKELA